MAKIKKDTDETVADGMTLENDGVVMENDGVVMENEKDVLPEGGAVSADNAWKYNKDAQTRVRNITNIDISVIVEKMVGNRMEIIISHGEAMPLNNEIILMKVEAGNPSFCGTDGKGSNASLFIEDEGFRRFLGFEDGSRRQTVLDDASLREILRASDFAAFKKIVEDRVKTYAEKEKLAAFLRGKYTQGAFDSVSKIDFVENYTGLKVKE